MIEIWLNRLDERGVDVSNNTYIRNFLTDVMKGYEIEINIMDTKNIHNILSIATIHALIRLDPNTANMYIPSNNESVLKNLAIHVLKMDKSQYYTFSKLVAKFYKKYTPMGMMISLDWYVIQQFAK